MVYLVIEDKRYHSTAKSMETVNGLELDKEQVGDIVISSYRGAPYKAEILFIRGMYYA